MPRETAWEGRWATSGESCPEGGAAFVGRSLDLFIHCPAWALHAAQEGQVLPRPLHLDLARSFHTLATGTPLHGEGLGTSELGRT